MKLKELNIDLQPSYSDNAGKYLCTITYEDEKGTTKLIVDPEISEKVLAFIGPVLTAAAMRVHQQFQKAIEQSITEANKSQVLELSQ
jgi:hypothetical protein